MSRTTAPQMSFADWELMQQRSTLDPLLAAISDLLDQEEDVIERIRLDLERGLRRPAMGRGGLTPAQVLRSLVLMRVKAWDYRELRERIADGYSLRQFTYFYAQSVPQHHAFNRAFNRITPDSMQYINELIVQTAVQLGLEDGDKLRVDSTVVQSEIHHPTDNTLLWDTVRVVTRLVTRLGEIVPRAVSAFHNRNRAAKRRSQPIQRMSSRERKTRQSRKYRELIEITQQVVHSARAVLHKSQNTSVPDVLEAAQLQALRQQIEHYCQLGEQVIDQARRRVLQGETVPNAEKLFSIFETHTDLIKQDADPGGIRPQGIFGRERAGLDHAIRSAGGQSPRSRPGASFARAPPRHLRPCSPLLRRRSRFPECKQRNGLPAGWGQAGQPATTWRPENSRARCPRENPRVQTSPAFSRRH